MSISSDLARGMIGPLARLVRSRWFGVAPLDPMAIGSARFVLLLTVVAASYLPARRTAAISPLEALRDE